MEKFFGWMAASASWLIIIGVLFQAIKNYKRKTCEGLSVLFILISFYSYFAWSGYGIAKSDFFLKATSIPGAFLSLILVFQYLWYDQRKIIKKILFYPLEAAVQFFLEFRI